MMTRSKVASAGNIATSSDLVAINKENYNPVTGERAAPLGGGIKKPKATVLATKALVAPVGKAKREKEASTESATEPELKKRKASAGTTSKAKAPKKDSVKGTKKTTKRTGLKKVAPMPQLTEEDTAIDADARCYELTVKPLADVSQAYEEDVFGSFAACAGASASAPEGHVKFSTVKVRHRYGSAILQRAHVSICRSRPSSLRFATTTNLRVVALIPRPADGCCAHYRRTLRPAPSRRRNGGRSILHLRSPRRLLPPPVR